VKLLSKPQKKREMTFLIERLVSKIPVYDFKCECGKTSTITVELAYIDKFRAGCICGKLMTRVLSVPAVTFKGSGWGKDKN
jgi:predicted nucleic acid-binding Zn ribbon protein